MAEHTTDRRLQLVFDGSHGRFLGFYHNRENGIWITVRSRDFLTSVTLLKQIRRIKIMNKKLKQILHLCSQELWQLLWVVSLCPWSMKQRSKEP